ncbi:MAG: ATP-binding protein [Deltaproteobacteria bacterium]|nr:ATP-binding protein [Deltaproteobacteria bacterium]
MNIDWHNNHAAIWRQYNQVLRPVRKMDPVKLSDLVGIDDQKNALIRNTERFLNGKPANNALLWGARGTGKSSLVKAVFNNFRDKSLRLIEVDKDDLVNLPEIVDCIRDLHYKFIIFCDDLSFDVSEGTYKHLKSVLEGSVEVAPDNILIYATSNRRHLIPEKMQDNLNTTLLEGELHYSDAVEEQISLSDRFGLWLSFYPGTLETYLQIVDSLFSDYSGDRELLHESARLFALGRASKSGRTARQFFNHFYDR